MELGEVDETGRRRPVPVKGSEFIMDFDTVVTAIGQVSEEGNRFGLSLDKGNVIPVNFETMATEKSGVFAGGDVATGPASIVEAIVAGRKAAASIDKYLGGRGQIDEVLAPLEEPSPCLGHEDGFADRCRVAMPCRHVSQRLDGFDEVNLGFDDEGAVREAARCLQCDIRFKLKPAILPSDKATIKK
jgi:NADH-quinone oxidoreductase subunit F